MEEEISDKQIEIISRVFNLTLNRAIEAIYSSLDKTGREMMENIFVSGTEKEKEEFLKNVLPDFKRIFEEESKKIAGEIRAEIENPAK